jgi:hypothetical protein
MVRAAGIRPSWARRNYMRNLMLARRKRWLLDGASIPATACDVI